MANRSSESPRFESIQEPGQAIAYGPGPQMLYTYPSPGNKYPISPVGYNMPNIMQMPGIPYLNSSPVNSAINRTEQRSRPNSINSSRDEVLEGILEKLKEVDEKLEKLDLVDEKLETLQEIKVQITSFETKLNLLDMEVKSVKGTVAVLESSVNVLSKQMEERGMDESSIDVYSEMKEIEKSSKDLHKEMLYVQSQLMKNNLILFGINELPLGRTEDCIETVKSFCADNLEVQNVKIENAYRTGRRGVGKKRPIIATFQSQKEKEIVQKSSFKLKDTAYGISQQYPKERVDRRKKLVPVMARAKRDDKTAFMRYDKLIIDGEEYKPPVNKKQTKQRTNQRDAGDD